MNNSASLNALFYISTSGVVAQLLGHVQPFVTQWTAAQQASLSFSISQSLLKLMYIQSVMLSNHLVFCHPLLLLLSIFPSSRVFSSKSALCIRQIKYWSFSFSISPSNKYSGLISIGINWFDLLAVCSYVEVLTRQRLKRFEYQFLLITLWFQGNY